MPTDDAPAPSPMRPGAQTSASDDPERASKTKSENWWDYCPLCGARLYNRGCKYRCPRCRYFMSCSDFD